MSEDLSSTCEKSDSFDDHKGGPLPSSYQLKDSMVRMAWV